MTLVDDLKKPWVGVLVFLFVAVVAALFYLGVFNPYYASLVNFLNGNPWVWLVAFVALAFVLFSKAKENRMLREARPDSIIIGKQLEKYPEDWETKARLSFEHFYYQPLLEHVMDDQAEKPARTRISRLKVANLDPTLFPYELVRNTSPMDMPFPNSQWILGWGASQAMLPYLHMRTYADVADLAHGFPEGPLDRKTIMDLVGSGELTVAQAAEYLGNKDASIQGGVAVQTKQGGEKK